MQYGTINDITNLKFYTDNGIEIPMQKSYSLTWEIIPGDFSSYYMQEKITGYFIGDIDFTNPADLRIKSDSLITGIINPGKIMVRLSSSGGIDKNGMKVFKYGDIIADIEYFNYIKRVVLNSNNKVIVSINVNNKSYTNTYKINDIFSMSALGTFTDYYNVNNIYTGNNIADEHEYYQVLELNQLDFIYYQNTTKPYIQKLFEDRVPNIGNFFPFVTYSGLYYQEKISEGFIAANTVMVLEENKDDDGNIYYDRPYINSDTAYYILFTPTKDGELKVVKKDLTYDIEYVNDISFDLSYHNVTDLIEPLYFTIAFQAEEEGAYQNQLEIYMKSKENTDKLFYMGFISIKTEVEGEDERFRTLLTNFGVPDPVYYSNLFAEQDFDEQGKDYELINRKSKQLMLTYDSIFKYVGTYKALMNAVKFLGYYDLIFKEWYTLKTSNDTNVDIAVQVFDTSAGTFLKQKLADYGVSIEDFRNYNKINKLSMIYHINQESDELETCIRKSVHYDSDTKQIIVDSADDYVMLTGVPLTQLVYIYRNDEILLKLMAVKKWLERHIIGVGAYIADITGEGLYFGWQKTQGYMTQHHLEDFSGEQYYTPNVEYVSPFKNSQSYIYCTLNELNNAVKFENYNDTNFNEFIKYKKDFKLESSDGIAADISTLIISNTINTPVLGDEYEFDLIHKTKTGTLYEWNDSSTQILFDEGEMKLLFGSCHESTIKGDNLPYIILENANIRRPYGPWRNNIQWMIREAIDVNTGNVMYKLKNYDTFLNDSYACYNKQYYILEKTSDNAYIKYTEDNVYGIPMLIINGFSFMNADIENNQQHNFNMTGDYIIEILKGDILFKEKNGCSVKVKFDDTKIQRTTHKAGLFDNEQNIELEYIYKSDRLPFVLYDETNILNNLSDSFEIKNIVMPIIEQYRNNIISQYNDILQDILSFSGQSATTSVAYQEALSYINNTVQVELENYLNTVQSQISKMLLYEIYTQIYSKNIKIMNNIPVKVTRSGQYELISRSFDRYNNTFVAKYDKSINVFAKPIKIDTYTYNSYSNNVSNFYRYNTYGEQLKAVDIQKLINKSDKYPHFPINYLIDEFDNNYHNQHVLFDNISYCIDTPKNNNFVIFENAVERCINAVQSGSNIRLYTNDAGKNNLYSNETNKINIVLYDKMLMDDVSVISGIISRKDNINFIIDAKIDNIQNAVSLINNKEQYNTYILNTTEYNIDNFDIIIDYDNRITTFTDKFTSLHDFPIYNIEDVIKLRYYRKYTLDSSNYQTISEATYRITDIQIINTDDTVVDMQFVNFDKYDKNIIKAYRYIIDGIIDYTLLNDYDINCIMTYANHYPVHYVTKVSGDGLEYIENAGYDDYYILRDEFIYNGKHMNIDKYIDDTYGGRIMEYDMFNLKNSWIDIYTTLCDVDNIELFKYQEFPVSIKKDKFIMFTHNNIDNVLLPNYQVQWKVSTYMIDDIENWDNYRNNESKKTLFMSVNNILPFNANILGPYDIQLICTDIYGNKIINEGSGKLYVTEQI
ncbi:MAG: hypothetical protein [Wendovervirus sonii]|uniref:Uncharacterized protein n=1 Tax=phage Lak_Megaphage_Sonny TaxID=3109229 RepID=A0ABZ0Z644_9CAUD|nr:MAG: hypothetical protein [phage Lak_Megaphage_Sonny]